MASQPVSPTSRGSRHRPRSPNMEALTYAFSGLAVAGIYCVYSGYIRDRTQKLRSLRRRVTYMLWKASRKVG